MNKSEILFYDSYEEFYAMVGKSNVFQAFCIDAFGEDFLRMALAIYIKLI